MPFFSRICHNQGLGTEIGAGGYMMSRTETQREVEQYPTHGSILLVEDDPDDVKLIGEALTAAGICLPVIHLENGEEAVKYLSLEQHFDDPASFPLPTMVLLDLKMPKQSGFSLLEWIRSQEHLAGLVVVVLTGSVREEDRVRARELGARDFQVKPVSFFDLVEIITLLGKRWMGEFQDPIPMTNHE